MIEGLYLIAGLLSLMNGLAVFLVNPRRVINQVYLIGTLITCVWFLSISWAISIGHSISPFVPNNEILFWLRLGAAVPSFIVWQIAMIHGALLSDTRTIRQTFVKSWPWFLISALLACLAFSELFIPSHSTSAQKLRGPGYLLFQIIICACGVWILASSVKRIRLNSGIKKLELQLFVALATFACLLGIICNFTGYIFPEVAWLRRTVPIWITIWQGSVVWVISHRKVFDGRQVLTLVGQRILLLTMLGASVLSLSWSFQHAFSELPSVLLATTVGGCLIAFCDRPTRRWFGLDPELLLAQPRKTIIDWARQAPGEERLRLNFEGLLREWCQTDKVMLLSLRGHEYASGELHVTDDWDGFLALRRDGWTTPESMERRRETPDAKACQRFLQQHQLGALVAAPSGGPHPSLLVACGQRASLRPYTYPDIQLLQELTRLMDNILTHSRMAAHVARMERMEAAAMMSRGLAHDLNNLATPVSTFLLHMESHVAPDTPEADVLRDAKHAVRVMQDYIRESLFFTRQLAPDFQSVDIPELLPSVLQLTQARALSRGVTVKLGPVASGPFAADGALIKRLLQNLVFNGIDATPRGGTVTLSCHRQGDSHLTFSVADEGAGVPHALLSRIFEPYFTTKDTGHEVRGLGLGLAICRKISDLHGGEIAVGSTPAGGAIFTVKLPVAAQSASTLAAPLSVSAP